jgi:choline-glycine betaine transporter
MTLGGWITMLLSVGFVTGLLIWCVARVLRTPGATEHLHAPGDIEPEDTDRPCGA